MLEMQLSSAGLSIFLVGAMMMMRFSGAAAAATINCGAGKYLSSATGTCLACVGSTYCTAGGACAGTGCPACPVNTAPDAGRTTCVSGQCAVCPIGAYCGGGNLILACPAGTFGGMAGLSTAVGCTPCAAGTFTSGGGFTVCPSCAAGSYAPAARLTACLNCAPGTFQGATGALNCTACPAGTMFAAANGTSAALACTACAAGTYSTSAAAVCTPCGPGTYATAIGLANASRCIACAAGSYATGFGAAIATRCIACMPGAYQPLPGGVYCVACYAGSYLTGAGATAVAACLSCPASSTTPLAATGATSLQQCACNAGFFTLSSNATTPRACAPCAAGSYASSPNASACTLCEVRLFPFLRPKSHFFGLIILLLAESGSSLRLFS